MQVVGIFAIELLHSLLGADSDTASIDSLQNGSPVLHSRPIVGQAIGGAIQKLVCEIYSNRHTNMKTTVQGADLGAGIVGVSKLI